MVDREELREFVDAKCWAVVGATPRRNKFGNITFRELISRGKRVYPVNPKVDEVEGVACYPDLASLPECVERVLIVIPPERGVKIVKEADEAGVTHVWFQPGAESSEALDYCAAHGMTAVAGHCILHNK
jgi:predicted CoA-binding protein